MKVKDICDLINGRAFKPSEWGTKGLPIIRIQNLNDISAGFNYYSGEYNKEHEVNDGELLFSWSGTPGTSFGAFSWYRGKGVLNQHIFRVLPKIDIDKEYLKYAINGNISTIISKAHGGVGLQHITKKELENIDIPVVSKSEQLQIVQILTKTENLISLRIIELRQLDTLIKSRFIEMFGKEPNTVMLRDICSIITDGTHQPPQFVDQGIPFLFVSNIASNTISYDCEKFISSETYDKLYKRTPIEIGDIVLSTVGSYGHPAVVKSNRKFLFQRHIAYLKLKKDIINPVYLHTAILSDKVKEQIEKKVKGIAQKTLNLSEIKTIEVQLPPLKIQNEFADFVAQVDKSKLAVQQSLDELETLKKSLMQQYFG